MKIADLVREVGAKHGVRTLTDSAVEGILWEHTGFPGFWPHADKSPEENLRMQLEEFFANTKEIGP